MVGGIIGLILAGVGLLLFPGLGAWACTFPFMGYGMDALARSPVGEALGDAFGAIAELFSVFGGD